MGGGWEGEVKKLAEEFRSKCIVVSSGNAWINEELTRVWVEKILGNFPFGRRLLAWDSFSCHIMDTVKEKVKENELSRVPAELSAVSNSWFKQQILDKLFIIL